MKEEKLKVIKEEYHERKEMKKNIENMMVRIEELKENEFVKEYLGLLNKLHKVNYKDILNWTDDMMLDAAICRNIRNIEETNDIYVCLGTFILTDIYDIEHGPRDSRVNRNDPSAEYRIYQDLECDESIRIPIKLCEEFEKNHRIIYPDVYNTWGFYYKMQREFIEEAIATNQETACTKILSRFSGKKYN